MNRCVASNLRNLRLPVLALGVFFCAVPECIAANSVSAQIPSSGTGVAGQAGLPDRTLAASQFGYNQFRVNRNEAKMIDASRASWIVSNYGPHQNLYPFLIDGSIQGTRIAGGTIDGEVPLELDWRDIYINSAAVMARDAPGIELHGWTIRQAWDGIRIAGASDSFLIGNAAIYSIRDDAVENDHGNSGTISNSLFDGTFSGLSMTRPEMPDLTSKAVILDSVLMRMQAYPFSGRMTHQSPFKIEANSPALKIRNTVLAIEDVNHIGQGRLELAWQKTTEASSNHFLNLSDIPLPEGYPLPGKGWTVLQGQAARDHWQAARAGWLSGQPAGRRPGGPRSRAIPSAPPAPAGAIAPRRPARGPASAPG